MKDKKVKGNAEQHGIKDFLDVKKQPPKKMGHGLQDKRPHFKSFKSPGVK